MKVSVQEEWRQVAIDPSVTANHGQPSDLVLMDHYAAGQNRFVLDRGIARYQCAARDRNAIAEDAIVGDMSGSHDVVPVADAGHRFRLGSARDSVVLANYIMIVEY